MAGKERRDLVARDKHGFDTAGTTTFVGLRAIDPFFQYGVLTYGARVFNKIGIATLPSAELAASGLTRDLGFGILGLGLPLKSVVLLSMAVGSAVKQSFWAIALPTNPMEVTGAVQIATFNTVVNSINSLISLTLLSSKIFSGAENHFDAVTIAGIALYTVGITVETVSEIQRKTFKNESRNKGQVYTGGLFGYARHINYGGYAMWRAGYALVAGGPIWGAIVGAVHASDFINRAIPILDDYCSNRYALQWEAYKADTPYKLWPGIY